jgi:hypothetical protein
VFRRGATMKRLVLAVVAALILAACSSTSVPQGSPHSPPLIAVVVPHDRGLVVGGIIPCQGIIFAGGPHYAAGTVTVLVGSVGWQSSDPGYGFVFPTAVAAQQTVTTNSSYQFVLAPGHYVLRAQYLRPSNAEPFAEVTVKSGATVHTDIPNVCK